MRLGPNLNDLKPLFSRKKSLTFQKRSKKMFLHWRANLADQNKQQPLKMNIRVTYLTVLSVWNKTLIDTGQHCLTNRANQALRSLAISGFQNRGVCLQAFPSFPSPSPSPTVIFWLLFHFSRGQNRESRSSVFLCSETKRKRLLRRLSFLWLLRHTDEPQRGRNSCLWLQSRCVLRFFRCRVDVLKS